MFWGISVGSVSPLFHCNLRDRYLYQKLLESFQRKASMESDYSDGAFGNIAGSE